MIEGADKVAADPDSVAARTILTGHLHEALDQSPQLAAELDNLLEQAGVQYARQSAPRARWQLDQADSGQQPGVVATGRDDFTPRVFGR